MVGRKGLLASQSERIWFIMVYLGSQSEGIRSIMVYLGSQSQGIWSIMVGIAEYQDCTAPGTLHDCREAEKHR